MPVFTIAGQNVAVDTGISRAGAVDLLRQRGVLTPEQAANEVGEALQVPETGGAVDEFFIGAGRTFAERSFGLLDSDIEAPDSLAATLGSAAPLVGASFLVPGTGLAGIGSQAALSAGLEGVRQGSSFQSVAQQASLAGAGTGLGNLASRVVSGISRTARGTAGGKPVLTTAKTRFGQAFNRTLRGTGAFSRAEQANQTLINRQAAAALGQQADNLSPGVLGKAADDIGALFEKAVPDNINVNVTKARGLLDDVDFAGKGRILTGRDGTSITGKQWKALQAELRAKSSVLKGSNKADIADELDIAIDAYDAAVKAQADLPLLKVAREKWKILKNLEEISQVVETGNVPAGQLSRKLARESRKGFGTGFKRGKLSGVEPETATLLDTVKALASDKVPVGSPTASRLLALGPGGVAVGGLATGQLDVQQASALALTGLAPQVLGPLAFGQSVRFAGQLGAGLASAAGNELLRGDDQ